MAEIHVNVSYDIEDQQSIETICNFQNLLRAPNVEFFAIPVEGGGPHAECCPLPSVVVTNHERGYLRYEGSRADELMTSSDPVQLIERFRRGFKDQVEAKASLAKKGIR